MTSPSSRARSRNSGRRTSSSTATAAAHASGLPPKVPPSPPGSTASTISAGPVTAAERKAAAERLPGDEEVGLDAVLLDRPDGPGAADAALHLVGDEEDPVAAEQLLQPLRKVRRHRNESALALHGLEHGAGDRLRIDLRLEELLDARRARRRTRRLGTDTALARGRPRARTARSPACTEPCWSWSSSAASGRGRRRRRRGRRGGRSPRARS